MDERGNSSDIESIPPVTTESDRDIQDEDLFAYSVGPSAVDQELSRLYSELPIAIGEGSIDDVMELVKIDGSLDIRFDYELNGRIERGLTPLMLAVALRKTDIVHLIGGLGADITATSPYSMANALHFAARFDHTDGVFYLLSHGAKAVVNSRLLNQSTALQQAAANGFYDICSMLLEWGADFEAKDRDGWTSLMVASRNGHERVVKLLLERGAKVNEQKDGGSAALLLAAATNRSSVVRLLLDHGADRDQKTESGFTPCMAAAAEGHEAIVELLVNEGANMNSTSNDGRTALHLAAIGNHFGVFKVLSERNAHLSPRDGSADSPCHNAAGCGSLDVLKLLVASGADFDESNVFSNTPLHLACSSGHLSVVEFLLNKGAGIDKINIRHDTPLHIASIQGHVEVARSLLQRGAKIDKRNKDQNTPLHLACLNGHLQIAQYFLNEGAATETVNIGQNTALHLASVGGHLDIVRLLLDRDANPHARNNYSDTPLHMACFHGNDQVADLLLDRGALVDESDINHNTALHIVALSGRPEILLSLFSRGADINKPNIYGNTPLHIACIEQHSRVVDFLVDYHADVNKRNYSGVTPLHEAACGPNTSIVEKLLKHGADMMIRNRHGSTALHHGSRMGLLPVVKVLLHHATITDGLIDITVQDNNQRTPLHRAAMENHVEVVLELLKTSPYFPETPVQTKTCTATITAIMQIEALLMASFDQVVSKVSDAFEALMYWAVANGRLWIVRKCMEQKPEVTSWTRQKATWLHVAALHGQEVITYELLPYLNVSTPAEEGTTALHLAAAHGHHKIAEVLLANLPRNGECDQHNHINFSMPTQSLTGNVCSGWERVAAIMQKNNDQESPLSSAVKRRHKQAEALLWSEIEAFGTENPRFMEYHPDKAENILELVAELEKPGRERVLKHLLLQWFPAPTSPKPVAWTALTLAVYHSQTITVWWLLSNGGHLGIDEIQTSLAIAESKKGQANLLIAKLLRDPPQILEQVANPDEDHLPVLPEPLEEDKELHNLEGTIVDFYSNGKNVDLQYTHRRIGDIIYGNGPQAVMVEASRLDHRQLHVLKNKLKGVSKSHASISKQGRAREGSQNTVAMVRTVDSMAATLTSGSHDNTTTERLRVTGSKELQFRWIHVPANNMQLARDLVTRLSCDSSKTEKDHRPLARFFNRSWAEVAAGGGKHYMKPQCLHETVEYQYASNDSCLQQKPQHRDSCAVYMPYLNFGRIPSVRHKNQGTTGELSKGFDTMIDQNSTRIMHEPMSLDQYFYATIQDTHDRDHSQVISRYIRRQDKMGDDQQILVVDQLWIWIIDKTTIITTTTKTFDQSEDILLRSIVSSLISGESKGHFERPSSVTTMMELILGTASGLFMQKAPVVDKARKGPLEIFRESIREVADGETKLFDEFLGDLKKEFHHQRPGKSSGPPAHGISVRELPPNPYHIISAETELLDEIKDIRDELNILRTLAEDQETVWKQAFKIESLDSQSGFKYNHLCTPTEVRREIKEMALEADMVQNSINTLLDLRQKQASIKEAEFGRLQANDTVRQSNTIMVFTIVTIIFLPLSFLSSLFALDVTSFPHEGDNLRYPGWWLFPILFGVSAAVSIPCIFVAFNVNSIIKFFQKQPRSLEQKQRQAPIPPAVQDDKDVYGYSTTVHSEISKFEDVFRTIRHNGRREPPATNPC